MELPSKLLHIWWKTKYQPGFIQHFNFHKIEVGILQNNNFRINHILNPWYLQLLRSYFHIGTIGNTVWYLFDDINDYINLWEIPHICRGCGEKLNDVETLQVEQKIDRNILKECLLCLKKWISSAISNYGKAHLDGNFWFFFEGNFHYIANAISKLPYLFGSFASKLATKFPAKLTTTNLLESHYK